MIILHTRHRSLILLGSATLRTYCLLVDEKHFIVIIIIIIIIIIISWNNYMYMLQVKFDFRLILI